MMIYINPFLTTTEGHNSLFKEADANGYLVKKADGTPYLIKNTDFFAALIDLSQSADADLDQGRHQDRAHRQGRRFADGWRISAKRCRSTASCRRCGAGRLAQSFLRGMGQGAP